MSAVRTWRADAPFYLCALLWNTGLGMTYPLIPLYADSLGMSGVAIGALIALPVILQIAFNLVGGAITDRIGGRLMVLAACLLMGAGATTYAHAAGFAMLIAAQVVMVMSRAMFWPATWTIAGHLPGERGLAMGRLNAMTNFGQIAGTFVAGFSIAIAGFERSFLLLAGIGLTAFVAMLRHPPLSRPPPGEAFAPLARYARLLRLRPMLFIIMCAYISALPFSLSVSFYPLLFESYGYSHEVNGSILALRGIGAAVIGLLVARHLAFSMKGAVAVGSAVTVALAVGAAGLTSNLALVSLLVFVVGAGSGLMSLNFQLMISEVTAPADRGSANALGGSGWGLSHLTTPLLMGVLRDHAGIETAFLVLGALVLVWAVALASLDRWAFARR
ncbi:MAG: MFS transporter [Burkholderiales bacterium]|nr:MFS transporter [Burkholderiales bacterium]